MYVVTIAIPDERLPQLDHLHNVFLDRVDAQAWIAYVQDMFGARYAQVDHVTDGELSAPAWICQSCKRVLKRSQAQ